ncbi:hypothetical protein [Saccharothrix coeruleofusca]|uniref:Uncharacterized protein n=1 Tax=Saccharothrix coeruleofusca TaxID=33919 RepID=A0A918AGV9_9PSEU|nr:hypothetical protein [Saccharothrix coeruleofusca]GGP36003.1 hypothetical protein GCM10010185_03760 [Saccharothrix coeruleofusca]
MCRAHGRRCPGSAHSSRATQTTRKAVSRARAALRKAKASGDADAIDAARQRLDTARAAHHQAKDNTMRDHNTPAHDRDVTGDQQQSEHTTHTWTSPDGMVTNTVHGTIGPDAVQADTITGPVTIHNRPTDHPASTPVPEDVPEDVRAFVRAGLVTLGPDGRPVRRRDVTAPRPAPAPHDHHDGSSSGPVHITDRAGRPIVQAGQVTGGVWVNGVRQDHPGDHGHHGGSRRERDRPDQRERGQTTGQGFTIHNVNYAAPGAHVGSQHDVTGSTDHRPDAASADGPGEFVRKLHRTIRRAQEAAEQARQDEKPGESARTTNVASGDQHVSQQIGINLGTVHTGDGQVWINGKRIR